MARCNYIKPDGAACKAQPMRGQQWCYTHHPAQVEKRKRAGSKGGKLAGRGRPWVDVADIKRRLSSLADDVLNGTVDRADAAVVGQLLNVLLRAVEVERRVRETEEFAAEIEELKATLRRNRSTWGA